MAATRRRVHVLNAQGDALQRKDPEHKAMERCLQNDHEAPGRPVLHVLQATTLPIHLVLPH